MKKNIAWLLMIILLSIPLLYISILSYRVLKWKASDWFLPYVYDSLFTDRYGSSKVEHLIFVVADHYEPDHPQAQNKHGTQRNEDWLKKFRPIADKHKDSYNNNFRYTWFYAYDQKNDTVIVELNKMVYQGYGEIELHWHHPISNSTKFPSELQEALNWFNQYGALLTSGENPQSRFAFIHGNWSLDNSDHIDPHKFCGVNTELEILFDHGCFADFTFSTIDTPAQPKKINSIYYAQDDTLPKSYNTGIDSEVGKSNNDALMIFEGPIGINFKIMELEYSEIEYFSKFSEDRIHLWLDSNIHVKGRPEWLFVKIYSHGIQSKEVIENHLDEFLSKLEKICYNKEIKLHYMSAREAYNVVKAAEDGQTGNPENFRDYSIPKYCNMLFYTDIPVNITKITKESSIFTPIRREKDVQVAEY